MWKALLLLVPGAVTAHDTDLWLFDRSDGYRLVEGRTPVVSGSGS
jgi:hypothetical protein